MSVLAEHWSFGQWCEQIELWVRPWTTRRMHEEIYAVANVLPVFFRKTADKRHGTRNTKPFGSIYYLVGALWIEVFVNGFLHLL